MPYFFCSLLLGHAKLLFKVISGHTEKSSTIVTIYLPFTRWTELFEDTTAPSDLYFGAIRPAVFPRGTQR